jgi:hypothetical protein
VDLEGNPTAIFAYDGASKTFQTRRLQLSVWTRTSLLRRLMDVFLPAGYPSSVTPDYTPYQIYDTLQAFASTIAGLLASRAVFVGMGVGSEEASLVTTMLLYIAQETIGRVATILFAHQFSQRIEAEVKFYRFFADIVNDIAFVLDCLSPGLPVLGRACTLCVSNACRAVCGVSGGSSKAILSSHFAKAGNIGELNAKDGSQETVVSLIGMWIGGLVVSRVHGTLETWCCLIPLLALHLWANWRAVKSVRLTSLNANRAFVLFRALLQGHVKDLDDVGKEESILGFQPTIFRAGVSVTDFLQGLPREYSDQSRKHEEFVRLLDLFDEEDYVLWCDGQAKRCIVLLKVSASGETQAKALCHFLRTCMPITQLEEPPVTRQPRKKDKGDPNPSPNRLESGNDLLSHGSEKDVSDGRGEDPDFRLIAQTLRQNRQEWQKLREQIESAGWDLSLTNLTRGKCNRIQTNDVAFEEKKDR